MWKTTLLLVLCLSYSHCLPLSARSRTFRVFETRKVRSLPDIDLDETELGKEDSLSVPEITFDDIKFGETPSLFSVETPDKNHFFNAHVSKSKSHEGDDWWIAGGGSYSHRPSGNGVSLGTEYSSDNGLSLNGIGKWNFNKDHSLSGVVRARNPHDGQWLGAGALNYHHKPSSSNLQLGFAGDRDSRSLFLTGETHLGSKNEHGLSATGVFRQGLDGSPDFGGTFGYHHKPSNSNFGIGVLSNQQGNPQIAANGNFNFKNGAKLGLGGHFSKGPGFSSTGFQISGAF